MEFKYSPIANRGVSGLLACATYTSHLQSRLCLTTELPLNALNKTLSRWAQAFLVLIAILLAALALYYFIVWSIGQNFDNIESEDAPADEHNDVILNKLVGLQRGGQQATGNLQGLFTIVLGSTQ
eukprot:1195192-Prorocentrum_minimum.AAC.1